MIDRAVAHFVAAGVGQRSGRLAAHQGRADPTFRRVEQQAPCVAAQRKFARPAVLVLQRPAHELPGAGEVLAHPPMTFLAIMQWMPLWPSTVWVTCRSACRLHSM